MKNIINITVKWIETGVVLSSLVVQHYSDARVVSEIAEFLSGRWVAVHCERKLKDGRPLLVRYHAGKPLTVSNPAGFSALFRRLSYLRPRAFYGTANIYKRLETREDALNYSENVLMRTLTWDIDSTPENWKATVEAARLIVDELEREGVSKSVWLKWSGRGMHVHVHERALTEEFLREKGVLDTTWSAVQLILERVKEKINSINLRYGSKIKVENLMDPQRVFTSPLSLHRQLDVVCVALKPGDLDSFDPSWTKPAQFRSSPDWRKYEEGEAIPLAEKALKEIGGYLRKTKALPPPIHEKRFTVKTETPSVILPQSLELKSLRLRNPPGPLYRRKLLYDPRLAVAYLEDILSHYVLGNISRTEAEALISSTMNVTLLTQGYSEEDLHKLLKLYSEALQILRKLETPENLKKYMGKSE